MKELLNILSSAVSHIDNIINIRHAISDIEDATDTKDTLPFDDRLFLLKDIAVNIVSDMQDICGSDDEGEKGSI